MNEIVETTSIANGLVLRNLVNESGIHYQTCAHCIACFSNFIVLTSTNTRTRITSKQENSNYLQTTSTAIDKDASKE